MKYKLVNRKITFTENNLMIFTADLLNADDIFSNPAKLPKYSTINQNLIRQIVDCPENFRYVDHMFPCTVQLHQPYIKIDKHGKPVLKKGKIIPINQMTVYEKKIFDEDSKEWVWVENPEVIVHRIINRHYLPLEL